MTLNWCYSEPWPSAANNNLISYPATPKPCYYAVKQSLRPQMASARVRKYMWHPNETFTAEMWILNDLYKKIDSGILKAYLSTEIGKFELLTWNFCVVGENSNLKGAVAQFKLPIMNTGFFKLVLEAEGKPELNSEYYFYYKNNSAPKKSGTPIMNL
jgi:beta-mannosidase